MDWEGEYPSNVVICDTSVLPTGCLRKSGRIQVGDAAFWGQR